MTPNWIGLIAALATFLGVWLGHVGVRAVEFRAASLAAPRLIFISLGLACELGALLISDRPLSGALGIIGVTLLFDALELSRQFKRVQKGHAPANPRNPRHAPLIAAGQATTTDWLARKPQGRPVDSSEAR